MFALKDKMILIANYVSITQIAILPFSMNV